MSAGAVVFLFVLCNLPQERDNSAWPAVLRAVNQGPSRKVGHCR